MLRKISTYASELAFGAKVACTLQDKLLLAAKTIGFHWQNLLKRRPKYGNPFQIAIHVGNSRVKLVLRPAAGDLFVLYEVLLQEIYCLPARICDPSSIRSIVDCGANIGLTSLYFADRYPNARIIAVEPHPDNFKVLCANTSLHGRISPVHAAVTGDLGRRKFITLDKPAWGNHTNEQGRGIEISTVTIDSLMHQAGFAFIDILKIDIEGAEKELFEKPLFLPKVGLIIIELHGEYDLDAFRKDLSRWDFTATQPSHALGTKMITAINSRCPASALLPRTKPVEGAFI